MLVIADCKSDIMSVQFGGESHLLSKGAIALYTVVIDLIVSLLLWFAVLMAGPIQNKIKQEIFKDQVIASDFTVMVTQVPHQDSLEDLPGIYWAWAENINQKEDNDDLYTLEDSK